jgi:hypothetical protein
MYSIAHYGRMALLGMMIQFWIQAKFCLWPSPTKKYGSLTKLHSSSISNVLLKTLTRLYPGPYQGRGRTGRGPKRINDEGAKIWKCILVNFIWVINKV